LVLGKLDDRLGNARRVPDIDKGLTSNLFPGNRHRISASRPHAAMHPSCRLFLLYPWYIRPEYPYDLMLTAVGRDEPDLRPTRLLGRRRPVVHQADCHIGDGIAADDSGTY
jgi:hypothetical protein